MSDAVHSDTQNVHFVPEEICHILPTRADKNPLCEALANGRFEEASLLIASQTEAHLVECFERTDGSLQSCLHVIAAISDTEEATKLCMELMQGICNMLNREYILNIRTIKECDMGGWKVHARVAAIHIAAYSGNAGVVRHLCQDYGVDPNCSTSETLEKEPKKSMTPLEWAARKGHREVIKVLLDNSAYVNASRHPDDITALYIAAQNGHAEVLMLIY